MGSPEDSVATPRVAAGALFVDGRGRVLLVHPTYKDTWEVPGGCVERGESPAAACRRELREELDLDRAPGRLIAVDWAPDDRDGDKLLFLFDCGPLGEDEARITVDGAEIDRWQWVHAKDFDDYLIPRLSRRLRSALRSTADSSAYLEHGLPLREVPATVPAVDPRAPGMDMQHGNGAGPEGPTPFRGRS